MRLGLFIAIIVAQLQSALGLKIEKEDPTPHAVESEIPIDSDSDQSQADILKAVEEAETKVGHMSDHEQAAMNYLNARAMDTKYDSQLTDRQAKGVLGMLSDAAKVVVHAFRHGRWAAPVKEYEGKDPANSDWQSEDLHGYEKKHWDRRYNKDSIRIDGGNDNKIEAHTRVKMPWGPQDMKSVMWFDDDNRITRVDEYVEQPKR